MRMWVNPDVLSLAKTFSKLHNTGPFLGVVYVYWYNYKIKDIHARPLHADCGFLCWMRHNIWQLYAKAQ
jgi:hypothetical protein